MRLAWLTDIHLNFVDWQSRYRLFESLRDQCDAVAISGDIGESPGIEEHLREMEAVLQKPIYFVLGNHDFYRGSIAETRARVARLAEESRYLTYLTASGIVELTPNTALAGHDGWGDARLGEYERSDVILNDFLLIQELLHWKNSLTLDKAALRPVLNRLGDEAAEHIEARLTKAVGKYRNIIAVTHVPPFREAAWHQGRISDDSFLPFFACKAVGEAIVRAMESHPESRLVVLCGHTHSSGQARILDNVQVLTGEAEYQQPAVQQVFDLE